MKTFLISDTHFGHENILRFKKEDGTMLRDFQSIGDMDEYIISNWNKVVGPNDKIYHLGDVGFFNVTQFDAIFSRLNGTKILIKGNHDNLKLHQYMKHFKDVRAYHVLDKIALAHIPIHPASLDRWRGQVHGHLHDLSLDDPKYYNVSVEKTKYAPVDFEVIREHFDSISN